MTSPVAPAPPAPARDRLLLVLAGVAIALSVTMAIAGEVLHIAVPLVLLAVIAALGITLRIVLGLRARRSPALSSRRVLTLVSVTGLVLAGAAAVATIVAVLPLTTPGKLLADLGLHLVTVALLLALTAPARTIGWRGLLGTGLAGFLAIPAVARAIGVPILAWLGQYNALSVAVVLPFTEEVLKTAPVLLVLLPALGNRVWRPTAVDITLLGLMSGTGFAILENADDDRVLTGAATPFALLYPTMTDHQDLWSASTQVFNTSGHAVWTAFIAMGLGIGLLYRGRFRYAWVAIPVTFVIGTVEHMTGNTDGPASLLMWSTLNGYLGVTLLTFGLIALTWFEAGTPDLRGLLRNARELGALWRAGILLKPSTVQLRGRLATRRELPVVGTDGSGR